METYLSSSPDLDLSTQLNTAFSNGRQPRLNGTNTPKDLASRIKVLEIFTLHVLPRNEEWDYANSFISNSDILDEERREAFLQTLQELQEANEQEVVDESQDDVFDQTDEEMQTPQETPVAEIPLLDQASQSQSTSKHQRTSSEVDYGIEKAHPNGAHPVQKQENKTSTAKTAKDVSSPKTPSQPAMSASPRTPPVVSTTSRAQMSPPSQTPRRPTRKPKTANQNTLLAQARHLFLALSNLARTMAGTISKNPTALLRLLLFILAFVMAFSQRQVRTRTRELWNKSWEKFRGTVGMGVKVSYI